MISLFEINHESRSWSCTDNTPCVGYLKAREFHGDSLDWELEHDGVVPFLEWFVTKFISRYDVYQLLRFYLRY